MSDDPPPRVPSITERAAVPEAHREHFDHIAETRGSVRGPFAVLLNSPDLAGRVGRVGTYVRYESTLPDDVRELAILTTARAFDCPYEWAAHEPIAREAGVSDAAIDVIATRDSTDSLSPAAREIVDFGHELFGGHAVTDETFDAVAGRLGVQGVTELAATMGYYALLASVLNALEVLPDDGPALP